MFLGVQLVERLWVGPPREAVSLEEDSPATVAGADRRDEDRGAVGPGERNRLVEQARAEVPSLSAPGDDRPEEVGVFEAFGNLDAAEADDLALLLRDKEGLARGRLPVGDLALELLHGHPDRVADLLLGPRECLARERHDRLGVRRPEATQAAGHGRRSARCGRSRDPRPR
jgi:hypothetical protein